MIAVDAFDTIATPDSEPDPLVAAAVEEFELRASRDQFGRTRAEPTLSYRAGTKIILRDAWGEIVSTMPISEIQNQTTNH